MKNVLVALVLVLATVGYGQVGRYLPAGGTNGQVLGVSPSNVPWWTNASGGSGSGFPLTTNVSFGDYGASNINYLEMRDPVSGTRVRLSANTNGGLVGAAWMLTSSNLLFGTGITVTTNIANGTLTLNAAGGQSTWTTNQNAGGQYLTNLGALAFVPTSATPANSIVRTLALTYLIDNSFVMAAGSGGGNFRDQAGLIAFQFYNNQPTTLGANGTNFIRMGGSATGSGVGFFGQPITNVSFVGLSSSNTAPATPGTPAAWIEVRIGTNIGRVPWYQ